MDKIVFDDSNAAKATEEKVVEQKTPWYSNLWTKVSGFFTEKKDSLETKQVEVAEEKSVKKEAWYIRIWNNIKELFSNEENTIKENQ